VLTAIDGGKAMVKALSISGVDYCCLGNHEFDIDRESLAKHLKEYSGTCVNSNVKNKELAFLPEFALLKVGDRTALISGVCTDNKSIFSPQNLPDLTPPDEAIAKVWEKGSVELGRCPDLFIPMTHQLVANDRVTARLIAKHGEMKDVTPVVLGGHEHEVFVDEVGRSTLVKTGLDIETIGIIDIWWTANGSMRKTITLVPAVEYCPDEECSVFVKRQHNFMKVRIYSTDSTNGFNQRIYPTDSTNGYNQRIHPTNDLNGYTLLVPILPPCSSRLVPFNPPPSPPLPSLPPSLPPPSRA
jgi:2',3'-cyclic-nucleotide 2'-phosphodiesterase (5'-nucleotidase family)